MSKWALIFFLFFFLILLYFAILYWFCHTSAWIHHGCTCVPNPELPSHLPPHTISLGHPSAPAPSILYPGLNLDWRFVSYMILYMFQCHGPKLSSFLNWWLFIAVYSDSLLFFLCVSTVCFCFVVSLRLKWIIYRCNSLSWANSNLISITCKNSTLLNTQLPNFVSLMSQFKSFVFCIY